MWIDTHCHLNDPAFSEDYQAVIERAMQSGVERMLVVGYDLESSRQAVRLAGQDANLYAAVGVHPHDAKIWDETTAGEIVRLLSEPKVVALGEIGLDYHYDYSPREVQRDVFLAQLEMAKRLDKPVIIHNREAHQDTWQLLSEAKLGQRGGLMHCFTGSWEMAQQWLKLGLYLSVGGAITFKNAEKLRETVRKLPLDRLVVETDCPYMTPHPLRGQRNEPGLVRLVGEKLAELHDVPVAELMEITTTNAERFFGIV